MSGLPEDMSLLLAAIGHVDALEILLTLARAPRTWSPLQVAQTLRMPNVERQLERLVGLNLVEVRLGNDVAFRYAPTDASLDALVRELAREYAARRPLVLRALTPGAERER